MKRLVFASVVTLLLFGGSTTLLAQWPGDVDSTSYMFDEDGSFTRVYVSLDDVKAKLIRINPLNDDVIWKKVTVRCIDLRERQNWPLYYPIDNIDSVSQKNLFAIIYKALLDGEIKCYLYEGDKLRVPPFTQKFEADINKYTEYMLASDEKYEDDYEKIMYVTAGITKYYIQEMWYFDKRSSEMKPVIMAIAPAYNKDYNMDNDVIDEGPICWIPYERLRPYLQMEFMKTTGRNVNPVVDFDQFFIERKYDSYIISDNDVRGTALDVQDKYSTPDKVRKEQERIENEILNFELDLWSY